MTSERFYYLTFLCMTMLKTPEFGFIILTICIQLKKFMH